jgi:hypothetical protein
VQTVFQVTDMAHVIQLSVAPVFLLSGIGALLSVLTARVGRIVDRARQLESGLEGADELHQESIHRELTILARRGRWSNWAISLCTSCALLICTVIVILFVGAFLGVDVSAPIAFLFVFAMLTLIAGLLSFLHEIYLATAYLRIGRR